MAETTLSDPKYIWEAPLADWGMDREACEATIRAAGLPDPGKSSCWMCPSMKKPEILELGRKHPELLGRAVEMEKAAELKTHKGLGRSFAWGDYIAGLPTEREVISGACGCHDSSEDREDA
jgi:hypothetical protein